MLPKFRTTAGSFRTSNRELTATWSLPRVITCVFQFKGYRRIVVPQSRDTHQGEETVPCQRHWVRLLHHWRELEHLWVHVQGRDGSRSDYDAAEPLEDGFNRQGRIQAPIEMAGQSLILFLEARVASNSAREMKDRVWNRRIVRLEGFQYQYES